MGGRKPYFMNGEDALPEGKKVYYIAVLADTEITTLKSGETDHLGEETGMNIPETLKAGAFIYCDGDAFFTEIAIASGQIECLEAL